MMKEKMKLIHFGSPFYKSELFQPISDVPFFNKPKGGLWTSPASSKYGWREWCKEESYGDISEYFNVRFNGTVFKIDSVADMEKLPWIECNEIHFVSFQALCALNFTYDAIHLTVKGQEVTGY
jgi:hypothetical protein